MKLKEIKINQFASFKDAKLVLDPQVTVLVGRNDVGKTKLISSLLEQTYSVGGMYGRDLSRLPEVGNEGCINYEMLWTFNEEDNKKLKLSKFFNVSKVDSVEITTKYRLDMVRSRDKTTFFKVNKIPFEVYKEEPIHDMLVLKDRITEFIKILPKVRYISLSEKQLIQPGFLIKFYELPRNADVIEGSPCLRRDLVRTEETLIKLSGLKAHFKFINDKEESGHDDYGFLSFLNTPVSLDVNEIRNKFLQVSKKLTHLLNKWWDSPPILNFSLTIAGNNYRKNNNRFTCEIKISDNHGLSYYGAGLRWFVAFLVEYLDILENDKSNILAFDEPANNLHPSAQKAVVGIINELSKNHQIIYTTHSPFMLDWYAPHRIRVVEREYGSQNSSKRSKIINKPYVNEEKYPIFWWALRDSMGISLGDIGILGENNLLVEGVSDQILIASISRFCESKDKSFLDLNKISIIPLGGNSDLAKLIAEIAKSQNKRIFALFDSDLGGKKLEKTLKDNNVEVYSLNCFLGNKLIQTKNSIEDIMGIKDYVELVNKFYKEICKDNLWDWYHEISEDDIKVKKQSSHDTLGKIMEDYFKEHFTDKSGKKQKFDKVSIAKYIAGFLTEIELENIDKFEKIFEKINKKIN